jgi:hypothetical protein
VLAIAIPVGLGAEQLREPIALRGEVRGARRFDNALANWPQRGNVCKFIGKAQEM